MIYSDVAGNCFMIVTDMRGNEFLVWLTMRDVEIEYDFDEGDEVEYEFI
jgi:hypothetical protein